MWFATTYTCEKLGISASRLLGVLQVGKGKRLVSCDDKIWGFGPVKEISLIYFIRSYNEFVKIGRSVDPEGRRNNLQTANPKKLHIVAVMDGESQTEAGLHEMFSHLRVRGEWFRYSQELKWFIRSIQMNPEVNNIKTLYMESQKMRIQYKAKRHGASSKLANRISEV